ncbi:hypothetical protein L226DRAFT_452703 [Lentinus tigrinus ALCF2SS1-7]|uniref:Uncharacterized protein n=1 Tax=Lentinus tigrinus ALCF2SS1-6 TaxID=1328759 RepID=A0A5C2STQ8_9APHY|nr:hypothetical protein L227DRAFT_490994 [Lentinus tigrinus ALCF2SS1-6]RPD81184.1 hypothetical protein L226DRAFT_452703 [Lentinus tigrinus ALCF2SS1-7]
MKREHRHAPFDPHTIARPAIVRGYDRDKDGECCTPASFCVDIQGTPGSPWNASAANVFADDFLYLNQYDCADRDAVARMFRRHLHTIQTQYKRWCAEVEAARQGIVVDRSQEDRAHARRQRRYNTFQRRLRITLRYEETRRHAPLIRAIGPDGMSSDEEDFSNTVIKRYAQIPKLWRHVNLTDLFRFLDALHRWWRSSVGQGPSHGQFPRNRFLPPDSENAATNVSTRLPVQGLPAGAYDMEWLEKNLTATQRQDLRIQQVAYDFSIPQSLQE